MKRTNLLRTLCVWGVLLLPVYVYAADDVSVKPYTVSRNGKFVACGFKYSVSNDAGKKVQGNIYDNYTPLEEQGAFVLRIVHRRTDHEMLPTASNETMPTDVMAYFYVPQMAWLKIGSSDLSHEFFNQRINEGHFLEQRHLYKNGDDVSIKTLLSVFANGVMIGADGPTKKKEDNVYFIPSSQFTSSLAEEITTCLYSMHPELKQERRKPKENDAKDI